MMFIRIRIKLLSSFTNLYSPHVSILEVRKLKTYKGLVTSGAMMLMPIRMKTLQ